MKPHLLISAYPCFHDEAVFAEPFFQVYRSIVDLPFRDKKEAGLERVLCRGVHWPHGYFVERDLEKLGYRSLNGVSGWECVQEFSWATLLGVPMTPKTWFRSADLPVTEQGPFIVRGHLRSQRHRFNDCMFAKDVFSARRLWASNSADPYWGEGGTVIRRYVELAKTEDSLSGLPMAKEWRIFTDMGAVIAFTDYWGLAREGGPIETPSEAIDVALCASKSLASLIPFCAIDVALTARGEYIVVEVNHGGLSGLNGIDPRLFYARIAEMMGRDLRRRI
jgi:hypothetical protein